MVELDSENRSQFRLFFLEAIAEESDRLLAKITEYLDKDDVREETYRLRTLQELRKCIENSANRYLQRI